MLKPRWAGDAVRNREKFRAALAEWFSKQGKDYPWRRTRDPYEILVSEMMLQQTRVATVLDGGYYKRFLAAFPDAAALAAADDASLLKAWEGLGYYRRARLLRETARAVTERGEFPQDLPGLMALPGIGRYTAEALRAFAFDLPAAVVDGNVARVLARVFDFHEPVDGTAGANRIWEWAEALADPERPRIYNSALMELGQTHCRSGAPDCLACPVAALCKTREPAALPVKAGKPAVTAVDEHAIWLTDEAGRLLMHLEGGKRRHGLWKLPTRAAAEISALPVLHELRYSITRYRVTLRVHDGAGLADGFAPGPGEAWQTPAALAGLAMPAPFRRAVGHLSGGIGNGM